MSVERVANGIKQILVQRCPSAEVSIVTNDDVGEEAPGYYIGISASNDVEVDLVQSIMTMTTAEFVKWVNDGGDLMIYRIPRN